MSNNTKAKVVVIGAGIGGLTTAALLQKSGYAVTVLEAQTYPGGCASTFTHQGYRFESGATVVGGFQPDGPHAIAGERLGIDWPVHKHDPAWVTHLPGRSIALAEDNQDILAQFPGTETFWEQQSRVAALAWKLTAAGLPWPPRSPAEIAQLIKVALRFFPQDLQLIPFAFSSVRQWLRWHGLHKNTAFIRFLDAQLLISAQTTTDNVNALYGATALDLARQGVYHVEGGIGGVANVLAQRLIDLGGRILYRQRVEKIAVQDGRAVGVYARQGRRGQHRQFFPADFVIANTTPWNLNTLLGDDSPAQIRREVTRRGDGWGAFVLHIGIKADAIPTDTPDHHQIITSMEGSLGETRSLFISFSPTWDTSRAPAGHRAVTVTTHTSVRQWWDLLRHDEAAYYAHKRQYTSRMLAAINTVFPGFEAGIVLLLEGGPVTYHYYTDRHLGMVGGFPQTSLFRMRGPRTGIPNIRLVGDSIFPGQSTAGVTLGAMRVAADVERALPVNADSLVLASPEFTKTRIDPVREPEL